MKTCIRPGCGRSFTPGRSDQKYCSGQCKRAEKARRRRARERVSAYRERNPSAYETLADLPDAPQPGPEDPGQGVYAADIADDTGRESFADTFALAQAIEILRLEFEDQAQEYYASMKRNPGVTPAGLASLIREYRARIDDLTRAHERAASIDAASRGHASYVTRAHDAQRSSEALAGFARDLGRR